MNFKAAVKDKLFVYSYKINENGYANMMSRKTNLVSRPSKYEEGMYFYAVQFSVQKIILDYAIGKVRKAGNYFGSILVKKNF